MLYKAIFIDVDGTLLTDELKISEGTKEVLANLHRLGILICIVTARPPTASLYFYEELGLLENPLICFNGAFISQTQEIIQDYAIELSDVAKIIEATGEFKGNRSMYRQYDWYTEKKDHWVDKEIDITGCKIEEVNFRNLLSNDFQPNKFLCIGESTQINGMEAHLKSLGFPDLNIHKSKPTYLEIVNKRASKAQGIEKVINIYNIKREEIIAIGDNFNDVDMLKFAGMSIVMGNAPEEVKKYGTIITDTNNREGVRKGLERLFGI